MRILFSPLVTLLCAWRVHPNAITGLSIGCAAAIPFLDRRGAAGGVIAAMILHQVLDCIDGEVARRSGRTSQTGALLDSVSDVLFYFAMITIPVSRIVMRNVPMIAVSLALLGLWSAFHIRSYRSTTLIVHPQKHDSGSSAYQRAYAFMANNSLLIVLGLALAYALAAE